MGQLECPLLLPRVAQSNSESGNCSSEQTIQRKDKLTACPRLLLDIATPLRDPFCSQSGNDDWCDPRQKVSRLVFDRDQAVDEGHLGCWHDQKNLKSRYNPCVAVRLDPG